MTDDISNWAGMMRAFHDKSRCEESGGEELACHAAPVTDRPGKILRINSSAAWLHLKQACQNMIDRLMRRKARIADDCIRTPEFRGGRQTAENPS